MGGFSSRRRRQVVGVGGVHIMYLVALRVSSFDNENGVLFALLVPLQSVSSRSSQSQ